MARKLDYSTASESGMEFIGNRWVFAGDKGYRVQFTGQTDPADVRVPGEGTGDWSVFSYNAAHTRLVYGGRGLTEEAAHEMAASLSGLPVHPETEEV